MPRDTETLSRSPVLVQSGGALEQLSPGRQPDLEEDDQVLITDEELPPFGLRFGHRVASRKWPYYSLANATKQNQPLRPFLPPSM